MDRDKAIRDAAELLLAAANQEPKGVFFSADVTRAVPARAGEHVVVGVLAGSNLDAWARVKLDRRVPMGSYRLVVALIPVPVANIVTPGKAS